MASRGTLRTTRLPMYTLRTALSHTGMVCVFYCLGNMPISEIVAYYMFAELPSPWTWLGATLIFASSYYVLNRESGSRTQISA